MITASSTFDGTESPLSEGGAWQTGVSGWGTVYKVGGVVRLSTASTTGAAFYTASSFWGSQYSKIILDWTNVGPLLGPLVRAQGAGPSAASCYAYRLDPNLDEGTIFRIDSVGGTLRWNQLGAAVTVTVGTPDTEKLHATGSTLSGIQNVTIRLSRTDSVYKDGMPGLWIFSSNTGFADFSDWEAGDFGDGPSASQIGIPISDVSASAWLPVTGTDLYTMIDENPYYLDSDYIYSSFSALNSIAKVSLSALTDPATNTGHTVWYRIKKFGSTTSTTISLTTGLYQSSTLIAQRIHANLPTEWTTSAFTLTTTEADSITNYGVLQLWFTSSTA